MAKASDSTPTRTEAKEPRQPMLTKERREAHSARMKKFWADQREKRAAEGTVKADAKAKKGGKNGGKPPALHVE